VVSGWGPRNAMAKKTSTADGAKDKKTAKADAAVVTLTIDGQAVTVPQGTTLLQAAQGVGTEVPH